MTREEAIKIEETIIKWLESLKAEIGKPEHSTLWHYAEAIDMAIEALKAEPVKHGEWETGLLREFRDTDIEAQEKADKAGYVRYVVNLKCSACGKITMVDNSIKYNFCPHCGAKMKV